MHNNFTSTPRGLPLCAGLTLALLLLPISAAQAAAPARTPPAPVAAAPAPALRSMHVAGNVWMIVGQGGNVTVQIGEAGVLVVDTQFAQGADALIAEIARISGDKPIRYILNTHVHDDHIGGNARLRAAGRQVIGGNVARDVGARGGEAAGATIITTSGVLDRMAERKDLPSDAMPDDAFPGELFDFSFNGEAVQMVHITHAHTDGDMMVHFRRSDVIAAGDLLNMNSYPFIDEERGGHIDGVIAALNRMLLIAVPADKQEGGTMIIPGHGRLTDEADVVEYRDMLTIIRARIQASVTKGLTLDQVKATRPTFDYDGRWGQTTGRWTTDQFIEAVYRGVKNPVQQEH